MPMRGGEGRVHRVYIERERDKDMILIDCVPQGRVSTTQRIEKDDSIVRDPMMLLIILTVI